MPDCDIPDTLPRRLVLRDCASRATPTIWSTAPRVRWPPGPAPARRSGTCWSPRARRGSTPSTRPSAARFGSRGARRRRRGRRQRGRVPRLSGRRRRVRTAAAPRSGQGDPSQPAGSGGVAPAPTCDRRGAASTRPITARSAWPTVDAARDAGNRWVFRELVDEGLATVDGALHRPRRCPPRPTPRGRRHRHHRPGDRLACARTSRYLDGLGESAPDPDEMLRGVRPDATGERFGGRLAVSYELPRACRGPTRVAPRRRQGCFTREP